MRTLETIILKLAKSIEAKDQLKKKEALTDKDRQDRLELENVIKDNATLLEKEIIENIPSPKWHIGQYLYLDLYQVNGENPVTFDGGIYTLSKFTNEDKNLQELPKVEVVSVDLEFGWFEYFLEKFIEHQADWSHKDYTTFKNSFKSYMKNYFLTWNKQLFLIDNYSVYFDVKFKPLNFNFNPQWGLSEFCWINVESQYGKDLNTLHKAKLKLQKSRLKIIQDLNIMDEKIKFLKSTQKYK